MPTFPSNPTITSRLSTGSALTYTQMDTNFGNLTASIDSVIEVSRTASYVDSSNIYYTGTSQSFWSASISSSNINTATVSTLNVTNLTAAGTVTLNAGLTIGAGTITGNVTGSLFGTASWAYNASTASIAQTASYIPTFQQVITRGTFASSSTNIILAATDNVQIRGEAGSSNATASLSFGVGTNANNYILAGKALNIQGNRSNTNNLGVTILSAEDSNRAARITVGSGSNASRIQLATTIYSSTGPVTNLEIENQETFIYGPLTIGDDDPNGIYGSLTVTGSLAVTGSTVNLIGLPTTEPLVTGSLWLSGSGAGSASGSKYLMVFNG